MANIFIIGSGNFGTALAKLFSIKNKVMINSIDMESILQINRFHENKKFLPGIELNGNISATMDISLAKDCDVIILAIPSSAIASVCRNLKPFLNKQIIVSTSKGISSDGKVATEVMEDILRYDKKKIIALSGPSIANEMARLLPTKVMLGGDNRAIKKLETIFENESLIFGRTTDKRGIQLLGFYKNLIAILIGMSDGLKLGSNFEASLISKVYSEFYYLNIGRNIARHSFTDAAGLGDLYVTATSLNSRNRRFGLYLAKGLAPEEIKKEIGQVIEGYENLLLMKGLKDKSFIDENLLNLLLELTSKRHTPAQAKEKLVRYLEFSEIKIPAAHKGRAF